MLRDVAGAQRGRTRARSLARAAAMAAAERRAAPRADAVLCVSDADAAYFERLGGRAVLVPNGIDDALLDAPVVAPSGEDVLFFGQLSYEPNAVGVRRFLAESWPRVLARRPQSRLRVVGAGAPEDLATAVAGAPGAEFVGFVEDLRAELDRAALVVVPVWQGGGTRLKVLEALAAGRPIASTALGASGIGFRDGEHGLLANAPGELADAAAALLADPALAARLAAGGRRLAERFRWSRTTAPAEELYSAWT
jgi:glycosyltransferase involved in cell wall biosynthesis